MYLPSPWRSLWQRLLRSFPVVDPLLGEKSPTWVARLAGSEGRVLKMSETIVADTTVPAQERSTLKRFLPEMRNCHERMLQIAA